MRHFSSWHPEHESFSIVPCQVHSSVLIALQTQLHVTFSCCCCPHTVEIRLRGLHAGVCFQDEGSDIYADCLDVLMQEGKPATGDIAAESAQDWVCMEWGAVGGPAAREAVLWVQLQREFYRRNLLPMVAVRRLDALGFQWEPTVRGVAVLLVSAILYVLVIALGMRQVREAYTNAGNAEDPGTLMADRQLKSPLYSYVYLLTYLTQLREVQRERQKIVCAPSRKWCM